MSKKVKQYQVYVRQLRQWVEVDEEVYRTYQRPIDAHRKRMQYHHRCVCPKSRFWLCDGDCGTCEFCRGGDMVYLDAPLGDGSWTLSDLVEDESSDIQAIIEDRERLGTLFEKLEELDPEGKRICEMVMEGMTERQMADELGYENQSSVNHRKKKVFAALREKLDGLI